MKTHKIAGFPDFRSWKIQPTKHVKAGDGDGGGGQSGNPKGETGGEAPPEPPPIV